MGLNLCKILSDFLTGVLGGLTKAFIGGYDSNPISLANAVHTHSEYANISHTHAASDITDLVSANIVTGSFKTTLAMTSHTVNITFVPHTAVLIRGDSLYYSTNGNGGIYMIKISNSTISGTSASSNNTILFNTNKVTFNTGNVGNTYFYIIFG